MTTEADTEDGERIIKRVIFLLLQVLTLKNSVEYSSSASENFDSNSVFKDFKRETLMVEVFELNSKDENRGMVEVFSRSTFFIVISKVLPKLRSEPLDTFSSYVYFIEFDTFYNYLIINNHHKTRHDHLPPFRGS